MPFGILLDAIRAKWRVNGYRHRSCQQDTRIADEKLPRRRRQHQRNAPARGHTAPPQFLRALLRRRIEFAKSQCELVLAAFIVFGDQQMRAIGIVYAAVANHFHQRLGFLDDRIRRVAPQLLHGGGRRSQRRNFFLDVALCSRRRQNSRGKFFGRARLRRQRIGQAYPECILETRQQLDAFQASQAQIAVQAGTRAQLW